MIKSIYQRFSISLLILVFFLPAIGLGTGQKEYLIRISDSLAIEMQNTSLSQQISYMKQLLGFSDEIRISQISDRPQSILFAWYLVRLSDSKREEMMSAAESGYVEYTQENHSFQIHENIPNDPRFPDQWYHSKIRAAESWDQFPAGDDIILAIIDTGIDYTHPDLDGSLWINIGEDLNGNGKLDPEDLNDIDDDGNGYVDDVIGWDFTDAPRFADGGDYLDPDNDPMDEYSGGHGTRIAGIIAAQTANGIGIAALNPGVKVMNLRAGTAGGYLEEDDVARAVLYSINNGARIINMSFGDVIVSRFLKDVIEYAYSEGVIVVASSGNSGTDVTHYPSGLPQTISVGATDRSDQLAGFSNWGPTIDLAAPGVDILTPRAGGEYDYVNGTSFSAPMVSATVGFLLSANPGYTTEQIRNLLKSSADDIGLPGWDEQTGAGRLNMNKASFISKNSITIINYPESGLSVALDTLPIVITAVDPDLISINVSYGVGKDPAEWIEIIKDHPYQVVEDTIETVPLSSLPDTTILIKLSVSTWFGETIEYHSLISVDRTDPVISDVTQMYTFDASEKITLIEFRTDDITSANVFYRTAGSSEPFDVIHLEYETDHHYCLFQTRDEIEYYIRVTNLSGLSTIDNNSENFYRIELNTAGIIEEEFLPVQYTLPAGFMLDEAVDFDEDGNLEAVVSEYDEFGSFGSIAIFEFQQGEFVKQYETSFKGIPRSYGDTDKDGKKELLIGYGQKSYLLEASGQGPWPTDVVWSDTGDIWASRIADVDKDGISEIIAKRGQTFVMLEYAGENTFQQKYIFENKSPGENQLGPPRSEITDLDGDGDLEIYYGDYDGDLIIYENTGNDMFDAEKHIRLANKDATNYFVSGERLPSNKRIMIAGTHTGSSQLSEHQVEGLYWDYSLLSVDEENHYHPDQHIYIQGYANVRDFEAGLNAGYIGADNSEYIFLAPYPDLYIFKYNGEVWIPVWYRDEVNTNTILIQDFDRNGVNEFYFNDGQKIIGFERNASMSPKPPSGFEAFPVDTNTIILKWNNADGAADRIVI